MPPGAPSPQAPRRGAGRHHLAAGAGARQDHLTWEAVWAGERLTWVQAGGRGLGGGGRWVGLAVRVTWPRQLSAPAPVVNCS